MTTSGFYSYVLDTKNTSATITVDIERKLRLTCFHFHLAPCSSP